MSIDKKEQNIQEKLISFVEKIRPKHILQSAIQKKVNSLHENDFNKLAQVLNSQSYQPLQELAEKIIKELEEEREKIQQKILQAKQVEEKRFNIFLTALSNIAHPYEKLKTDKELQKAAWKFFAQKDPTTGNKGLATTFLYDSLNLSDVTPRKEGAVWLSAVPILEKHGFSAEHIGFLRHLDASLANNAVTFTVRTRQFVGDLYHEFLFQKAINRQSLPNFNLKDPNDVRDILNLPWLGTHNCEPVADPKQVKKALLYRVSDEEEKLLYQRIRLMAVNPEIYKKSLIDTFLFEALVEFNGIIGVCFNEQQLSLTQSMQQELFWQALNHTLIESDLSQNQTLLDINVALQNLCGTKKLVKNRNVTQEDILFFRELIKTDYRQIYVIDKVNVDLASPMEQPFILEKVISDFCIAENREVFLSSLLNSHRLPNKLLEQTLKIGQGFIKTRKNNSTVSSQKENDMEMYKMFLNSRRNIGIYTTMGSFVSPQKVTTFGAQRFQTLDMSVASVRERLKILIEAGCNINDSSPISNTFLHELVCYEKDDLIEVLLEFNTALPSDQRIDPNIKNVPENSSFYDHRTPLHLAVLNHRPVSIIQALLTIGSNVNARDIIGATPLHYAMLLGRLEVVALFLQQGGELNIRDSNNLTPFDYLDDKNVLALNFGNCVTAKETIDLLGKAVAMNFSQRSVGAIQNFALLSPDTHEYFWHSSPSSEPGNMDKKLRFPLVRPLYFEPSGKKTDHYEDLLQAIKQYKLNEKEQKFVIKQIDDLDQALLIDEILEKRAELQKLAEQANYNPKIFLKLLLPRYEIMNQLYAQFKAHEDKIIKLAYEGVTICIERRNGYYNVTFVGISEETEEIIKKAGQSEELKCSQSQNNNSLYQNLHLYQIQIFLGKMACLVTNKELSASTIPLQAATRGFFARRDYQEFKLLKDKMPTIMATLAEQDQFAIISKLALAMTQRNWQEAKNIIENDLPVLAESQPNLQ